MNTESVIASPSTTSTGPSPSTLIAIRDSCAHGKVCRWPLSRSMRTSSACTSLANSVASTARDGPLGSPWYKVILMSAAPADVRLFEDRDALDQVGPSQGPACLGGGARIDGTEPPQYVGRSEEHTSELQSLAYLVCRLLLEKKKKIFKRKYFLKKKKKQRKKNNIN